MASWSTYAGDPDRSVDSITYSNYAVPAGDDKILCVGVGIEEGGTLQTISSVTFDGNTMDSRIQTTLDASQDHRSALFDYQLGSSTPTGDVVVTISAEADDLRVHILTGIGLAQQAPEATASGTSEGTATHTTSITTVTADAEIIDCCTIERNTGDIEPTETGQTKQGQEQDKGTSAISTKTGPTTPGSTDMTWDHSTLTSVDYCHVVAAYEVAGGGGGGAGLIPSSLALMGVGI